MVELQRGLPLLFQQFKALLKKNLLLSWRNKRATFMQLFSSLFFIFLIFVIEKAISSRFKDSTAYENVFDPEALISPAIPPCEEKFYVKLPCYDFVWSGNRSPRIQSIVNNIMANNPGRPIPAEKVRAFDTKEDVDAWLFSDPMRCPGALHFRDRNATVISYGIQTNSTAVSKRGEDEDPTFKFQVPLQIAAEREIARTLIQVPNFSWVVGIKEFAHPAIRTFSAVGLVGPTFFLAIAMFAFVFEIGALVAEKELKLRQAMSIMGLYETAYWLSWLTWEAVITLISSLFIVLFGMMFQFNFFLHNNFLVLFLIFFLFQFNMIGLAFLISTFISKSSSATTVGFSIFIVGFLTQARIPSNLKINILVTTFGFPYTDGTSIIFRVVWSFFPPNLLAKALDVLGDATGTAEDNGISWSGRGECPRTETDCVITINDIYIWLVGTFILWFLLALYFDNVIPNASGVRKSCFYFLKPGYWTGRGGGKVEEGGICSCTSAIPPLEDITPDDEDVREEENIVKQQMAEGSDDPNIAVQVRGLAKTYPGTLDIGCCKCKRTSPYHAVKGLWVNFQKDQLFCLLGPNGAGKTTAINCLTGNTPVTGGDALIYGYSVRSSVGMSHIRRLIGVCPQFDILWDELSGKEHLHLFASIKGLPPATIKSVVERSLAEVKLANAVNVRAGSCSGGMKRRLSVAIALIGDPKLVILDEPTTGMDPITRRHVWDIIEDAKKGRAIVLTTHSMEEADILGDRIAIMAKGKLRCIGTSIRLKSRFGTGFIANVSFVESTAGQTPTVNGEAVATDEPHHLAVKQFFKHHLDVVPKEENKSFLTFVIPHEKEGLLTKFFEELQDREKEFGISDIQLGLTTLEEVFLNIAKRAELESAVAEGSLVTLTLTSGQLLEIPRGARFVGIPGTDSTENPRGVMVEVYWEQDETGALCISGHSSESPVPPNVQPKPIASMVPTLTRQRSFLGRTGPVHGIIYDPTYFEGSNQR
ncbi:ABC transporter-like [Macleaya cordata]|uniref:ABC transporter-like n=1 Tax=Macleaya cordata TaxID=56857 RepID=A0A200QF62_MACCD|nr:ABC transporter-like [Macleaya cordata]